MQLKPNTTATLIVGRLLDYQYGKEPAVGVAYNADGLVCRLIKDGVASVKSLATGDWAEIAGGFYMLDLTAEEVGGEGELIVALECQYNFLPWQMRVDVSADKLADLYARFLHKAEKSATAITVYELDGETVRFEQAWNANGDVESVGAAQ